MVYRQVENIKQAYNTLENSVLNNIKNLKEQIVAAKAEITELQQQIETALTDAQKEIYKGLIETQNQIIDTISEQVDSAIKNYQTLKQQAIQAAKANYETLKTNLVNTYKAQVSAANQALLNHLDAKLAAGEITQDQYNYWKQLANNNK